MQPRVADLRVLADALSVLSHSELDALLRARQVSPTARLIDFFDLAELLLSEDSLRTALAPLDRTRISALTDPTVSDPTEFSAELARRALLVEVDGRVTHLESVTTLAREISALAPSPATGPAPGGHPAPMGRLARGERALSELLIGLGDTPARELIRGGLAQPELRRLGTELGLEPEAVPAIVTLARDAGLIARTIEGWVPTDHGEHWLGLGTATRWVRLATAWADGFPPGLERIITAEAPLGDQLAAGYPAATDALSEAFTERRVSGELLGLLDGDYLTDPARLLLTDPDLLEESVTAAFPAPITGVYLQHDLSIILPGTLAPHIERTLRGFADLEARAEASTYRLSDASIIRGLSAGTTGEEILSFLTDISLTGIPQPVRYLVSRGSERFGSLVIRPHDGQTILRVTEPPLLDQMLVDRNLSALALRRDDIQTAHSRFDPDVVFWALTDARYPVVAHTISGEVRRPRRRVAPVPVPAEVDYHPLIEVLTSSAREAPTDTDAAWMTRRLSSALRAKESLQVTVTVPGRGDFTFTLEPTGISGGRLRGLDKAADTERTFPISSITAVAEL
ncbi:hypothetical protein D9V32_03135 [Mycetocola tolaasinivorans]|uniref:Helicase XPB/Ssl2 N-terminal domain-containing protein n=1 Tax=Mycetocola tolaasinivorans TaxID=76635 RepID=A0A3L7AAG5_9MICO|nr:helicase-associated domain-containing protein [Mycetocola tolaasinivorans]RLP77456.1 hypothetical protein D9V32_03135 [Mycetocola tolaasinivorans]